MGVREGSPQWKKSFKKFVEIANGKLKNLIIFKKFH